MTILNISALLLCAIGCQTWAAAANAGDSGGETIRIENGIILVDVSINGRGPFKMVVDTGASSCILRPAAAQKAGLVFDRRMTLATIGGEKVVPAASHNTIQVGGQSEPNVDVLAAEMRHMAALRSRADGVLGQSFLSRTPYLIDYLRRRIWLGAAARQEAEWLPIEMSARMFSGRIVVPVILEPGGRTWWLTLDSGASCMVVECRKNCPHTGPAVPSDRLITLAGEHMVAMNTFTRVKAGGVSMPAMDAVIVNLASPDGVDEGVLPTRWFSAVYVDRVIVKVRLKPADF